MAQKLMQLTISAFAPLVLVTLAQPALAQEPTDARFGADDVTVSASVDYLYLFGNELVYEFDGSTLSHLLWETSAAFGLTGQTRIGVTERISLYGSATIGLTGNSFMTDYDYMDAWLGDYEWTDRSRHPNTALDHYVAVDIGGQFDVYETDKTELGIIGGFRYTDVKWSASGGDFVYSSGGFRDFIGIFPDDLLGISYQQKLPAVYTGLAGSFEHDKWTFSGSAMIGAVINSNDIDHHWLRDLRFLEDFRTGLYLGASANAAYKLNQSISLTLGARYDYYGKLVGSTTTEFISTGVLLNQIDGDAAGADFRALKISAGLNAQF